MISPRVVLREGRAEKEDYLRRVNEKVLEMYGRLSARAVIDRASLILACVRWTFTPRPGPFVD